MYIPSREAILQRPEIVAIPVIILVILLILGASLLVLRSCCPYSLPRCLRPSDYHKYDILSADSALQEITVDTCDSSAPDIPFCGFLHNFFFNMSSKSATVLYKRPTFSEPSCTSSSSDSLPSLSSRESCGVKRKTTCPSSDEESDWVLEDRYYLQHNLPVTEAEVHRKLEKVFTGRLPEGEIPQFFIYDEWGK